MILFVFTAITAISVIAGNAHGSFETVGTGARTAGLCNAFAGDADDVYGIYYNPAGLVQLDLPEFSSYYGKLYMGLSDESNLGNSFFAYAHPLRIGRKYDADDDDVLRRFQDTNYFGAIGAAYQEFKLDSLYKETSIHLSYARIFMPDVYMGLTIKNYRVYYGHDRYTENAVNLAGRGLGRKDPLFDNGTSKSVMSYDLGVLYKLNKQIKIGLMLANINQPDISLESIGDKVNLCGTLGASGNFRFGKINIDLVREKRVAVSTDTNLLLGYENWLNIGKYGDLGLRCGYGEGSREFRRASMGFSYRINIVQLDYGFSIPLRGIEDTMGSHKLGMTFRFGKEVKDEDLGQLLEKEEKLFFEAKKEMEEALEEKKGLEFEIKRMKAQLDGMKESEIKEKERKIIDLEGSIEKAKEKYEKAFKIAQRFYNSKLIKDISLKEKIVILENVVEKYKKVGMDVSEVNQGLEKMKSEYVKKQREYQIALKYYRMIVEKGASAKERKDILNKLVSKYKDYGFDMKEVKNELRELSK